MIKMTESLRDLRDLWKSAVLKFGTKEAARRFAIGIAYTLVFEALANTAAFFLFLANATEYLALWQIQGKDYAADFWKYERREIIG